MIDLVFRNEAQAVGATATEDFFKHLIERTLATVGITQQTEVSVNLVDAERMRSLNKEYRNRDTATDVLSFPLGESIVPGYTIRTLGDIFICPTYAAARAQEEGISLEQKMSWLVVHGTLHLLDYDHERSDEEAEEMDTLEKKILNLRNG